MHAGEHDAAWRLLDEAFARYPESDHVHANTMNAAAHFVAGCLHERAGATANAGASFTAGAALAESRDHRLGIGAEWVKCRCGTARLLARSGARAEATEMLHSAREVFRTRSRFVWAWILNASDCNVHYEIASALATLDRHADALGEVRSAIRFGNGRTSSNSLTIRRLTN